MTDDTEIERPVRAARFWEQRTKCQGIIQNGEELRDACMQYFAWVDDNPLIEEKITGYGPENVAKMRVMTVRGLCLFIGISKVHWYEHYCKDERFKEVASWAEDVILQQKTEGASAGLLDARFIGKLIGLVDQVQQKITGNGPQGEIPVQHTHTLDATNLTDAQLEALASVRIASDNS